VAEPCLLLGELVDTGIDATQAQLGAEMASLAARRRRLGAAVERGLADEQGIIDALVRLERREQVLAEEIARAANEQVLTLSAAEAAGWLIVAAEEMPFALRRRLVRQAVTEVRVTDTDVVLRCHLADRAAGGGHGQRDKDAP